MVYIDFSIDKIQQLQNIIGTCRFSIVHQYRLLHLEASFT